MYFHKTHNKVIWISVAGNTSEKLEINS